MTENISVAIVLLTKEVPGRDNVAAVTIEHLRKNLKCEYPWFWYVGMGESSQNYVNSISQAFGPEGGHVFHKKETPGSVWNYTIQQAYLKCQVYLRMEDDFRLKEPLDITPYVKLLMERKDVGMVRLGLMPVGLDLHSVGYDGRIYFDCKKSTNYVYSGNPGLIHSRFHDMYGYFNEEMDPGQIEVAFDNEVRRLSGPGIWYPWDLGGHENTYGIFQHIGEVKSYEQT